MPVNSSSIGILIDGNDHVITDTIVFAYADIGIEINSPGTLVHNVNNLALCQQRVLTPIYFARYTLKAAADLALLNCCAAGARAGRRKRRCAACLGSLGRAPGPVLFPLRPPGV